MAESIGTATISVRGCVAWLPARRPRQTKSAPAALDQVGASHDRSSPSQRPIFFTISRDRCSYIGRDIGDKAKWLADHRGSWRHLRDVLEEADRLGTTEAEVRTVGTGPVVRKVGDDIDNVALVGSLGLDDSSLPTPVKADVTNQINRRSYPATDRQGGHE